MNALLTVAVILVGALCVLNLTLTVGVIRRLREHTELIQNAVRIGPPEQIMLPAGETVGPFSAVTEEGVEVSRDTLADETLVGVFSPTCSACAEQLPLFVDRARSFPGGRDNVLAVVVGSREEAAEQLARLAPVARVAVEDHGGPVAQALGVKGFPAFARLAADGKVLASGYQTSDLGVPVAG
ncbi:TlpA family protein disulfide reductase [Thermobifida cellulosilytica]|uniref:TlpA family protein disulfide reductase n=1 Tax=Thermobifida cellulosilytica TaxID=144786 RepID=UPI000839AD59|nr:redoxin family protein [Thermobifida cellulosilytica]